MQISKIIQIFANPYNPYNTYNTYIIMRKPIITSLLLLVMTSTMAQTRVQEKDFYQVANHVSIGAGLSLINGWTIELATPLTRYAAVRAGFNYLPKMGISNDLDINYGNGAAQYIPNLPNKIEVEAKPSLSTGHLMIDLYPLRHSSFHLTAGLFFGSNKVIEAYNKDEQNKAILQQIYLFNNRQGIYTEVPKNLNGYVGTLIDGTEKIGVEMGDYFLEPDQNGQVNANIQVKKVRPYLGLGFGRAVPEKHRFTLGFDMGVQLWGTPSVYVKDHQLVEQDMNGDNGKFLKAMSKITVYPSISLRLVGRVF